MDLPINQALIDELKESRGFQPVALEDAKHIYGLLSDKRAKVIIIGRDSYVVFAELSQIEFKVKSVFDRKSFDFISESGAKIVVANEANYSYFRFIVNEFLQGKRWYNRLWRLTTTITPLLLLNVIGYYFADTGGMKDVVSGILAAVSVFVAIFSLFTTSHEYLLRKRLSLFEKGKLGYYFRVDQHITRTGIYTILIAIFTLLICTGFDPDAASTLYEAYTRNIATVIGLNLSFLGVYLTLRTIIEFYVKRPAKFIMGDLKRESFAVYRDDVKSDD